jgi:D-glycero-D-manno-heptose 1,7-bisphosphate phosphatase
LPVLLLDRDGVINHDSAEFIKSADEFVPIDGSVAAIARAHELGWQVFVATNQSGLGRQLFSEFALAQMHEKLITLVEEAGGTISGIAFCPHLPDAGCECRKPRVGLLTEIEHVFSVALSGEPFVGDSLRDLEAAIAFGCQPILVRTGKGRETEARLISEPALLGEVKVPVFDDLASFVATLN